MPVVGSYSTFSFEDTGTNRPFPAMGANQTWDFSNVIPTGLDNEDYFNCVPLADCASFGNPDLLSGSVADSTFEYYKTTGNIFQFVGGKSPQSELRFSDPWDMQRFPFTYNSSYVETFSGTLTTPQFPFPISMSGTDSVDGVGYGTLITPTGTYNNVLLIRNRQHTRISIMGSADTGVGYRYRWFSANSRTPIMDVGYTLEDNGTGQLVVTEVGGTYSATPAAVESVQESASFRLSPNPSTGNTRLEIPASFGTNATVLITDISGKKVFSQTAEKNAIIDINTTDWAKGIYLVRVQSATGEALMQKLSVQ